MNILLKKPAISGLVEIVVLIISMFYLEKYLPLSNIIFTRFLAGKMERYKLPQKYYYIEELPQNQMKKLDRKALYRMYDETSNLDLMNPVISTILNRRSIREFTDKPIPKALIDTILTAGYHAPSGHNMQTWKFTVLMNQEEIQRLKQQISEVKEKKQIKTLHGFENPMVLILLSNDVRNENGGQDCSCAAENMMLAATSFGLGSVWLNHLKYIGEEPEIRALLSEYEIPDNHRVWAMIALGYPKQQRQLLAKKKNVVKFIQ